MQLFEIIPNNRSHSMTENEALEMIKNNCKTALNAIQSDKIIYRAYERPKATFNYIDPKISKRKALNIANYVNLIVSNSPKWKDFPKREKSIIATTDQSEAHTYGPYVYAVIPFDNARFGVCPTSDFWRSFDPDARSGSIIRVLYGVPQINNTIKDFCLNFLKQNPKNSYHGLMGQLKEIAPHLADKKWNGGSPMVPYLERYSFDQAFEEFLSPYNNDFAITNYNELPFDKNIEVWTDSPCIMVKTDTIYKIEEIALNGVLG